MRHLSTAWAGVRVDGNPDVNEADSFAVQPDPYGEVPTVVGDEE